VLLDLVGDKSMQLRREAFSAQEPHRALQDDLWAWGARLGASAFLDEPGPAIDDDHLAFQHRGVPSVDVIDLRDRPSNVFPDSHHTTHDDLSNLSPDSLAQVGRVSLAALLAWDAQAAASPGPSGLK
jgi:hypothetical protein